MGKHAWSNFFAPWNAGATIFVHNYTRFEAKKTLEMISRYEVTTLCGTPNGMASAGARGPGCVSG